MISLKVFKIVCLFFQVYYISKNIADGHLWIIRNGTFFLSFQTRRKSTHYNIN